MSRSEDSDGTRSATGTWRTVSRTQPWTYVVVATLAVACVVVGRAALALDADAGNPSIAHMDELWARREVPGRMSGILDVGKETLARDPEDYEAAWRVARAYWYAGHTTTDHQRARAAAEDGMRYAERAIALRPDRVEGHFTYALAIATYALNVSSFVAATKGVAAKFEAAALQAYALDRSFDRAGPTIALGRYYYELPWPLRDLDRSRRYLEEAHRLYPESLYARVYLAETEYALGDEQQAKEDLILVIASPCHPDFDHDPEATEPRDLARQAIERWFPQVMQMASAPADRDAPTSGTCRF